MQRDELKNLSWLKRETEHQERKLEELTAKAEGTRQVFSHLPKGKTPKDTMGDLAAEIADLRTIIEKSRKEYYREAVRLEKFIEAIPDSQMRMVMRLRHQEGYSWWRIGEKMGYDGSTVRKKYGRFLRDM
jgi:DNA-directed RNA polymerase specialized sigma24 family protein